MIDDTEERHLSPRERLVIALSPWATGAIVWTLAMLGRTLF